MLSFFLFLASSLVSWVLLNWGSLRASGSRSGRSTNLPCLMALTKCSGRTRSGEGSSVPSTWGAGGVSRDWAAEAVLYLSHQPAHVVTASRGLVPYCQKVCPLYLQRASSSAQCGVGGI